MSVCYCKHELAEGERRIELAVDVDWGKDDLRDPPETKHYMFHSFKCVADWATDRAASHDDVIVKEGAPDAAA